MKTHLQHRGAKFIPLQHQTAPRLRTSTSTSQSASLPPFNPKLLSPKARNYRMYRNLSFSISKPAYFHNLCTPLPFPIFLSHSVSHKLCVYKHKINRRINGSNKLSEKLLRKKKQNKRQNRFFKINTHTHSTAPFIQCVLLAKIVRPFSLVSCMLIPSRMSVETISAALN